MELEELGGIRVHRAQLLFAHRARLVQNLLRLTVVEAALAADDAGVNLVFAQLAGLVEVHIAGERAAVLPGTQAADVVAELFRQHGNHAVDQVHAGSAITRSDVDRTIPSHVARDIRDVHAQAREPFHVVEADGVVEVLGVDGVDGEHIAAAQVVAPVLLQRLLDGGRHGGGFLQCLGAELRGQAVVVDDDVHVHARFLFAAQHLHDETRRRALARGVVGDAREHHVAVLSLGALAQVDEHIVLNTRVLRNNRR